MKIESIGLLSTFKLEYGTKNVNERAAICTWSFHVYRKLAKGPRSHRCAENKSTVITASMRYNDEVRVKFFNLVRIWITIPIKLKSWIKPWPSLIPQFIAV